MTLTESEGWKPAEFHRRLWDAGLKVGLEQSNQLLINRRLRSKATIEAMADLLKALLNVPGSIDPELRSRVEAVIKPQESSCFACRYVYPKIPDPFPESGIFKQPCS